MTIEMQQHEPQNTTRWSFSRAHLLIDAEVENEKPTTRYQIVSKGEHTMPVSGEPHNETGNWWLILLPIAAGLVALFLFLSMGGLYAVIAPWVILAGIQVVKIKIQRDIFPLRHRAH